MVMDASSELPLLFERLRSPPSSGSQLQTFAEGWPGLLRLLRSQVHPTLRELIEREAKRYAAGLPSPSAVLVRQTVGSRERGGSAGLAKALHIRVERLPQVLEVSRIDPPARTSRTGRQMRVVTPALVEAVREHLMDCITVRVAQQRYGLSAARLKCLSDTSLIDRVGDRYSTTSLQSLFQRLASVPLSCTPEEDWITLQEALQLLVPRSATSEFFLALLSGELASTATVEAAQSTRDFRVCRSTVRTWINRATAPAEFMLIPKVALRLGLKQEVIYHLARVGLLKTTVQHAGRRSARVVAVEDLERFWESIRPWSMTAKENGLSSKASISRAASIGFQVISGPTVDGGRQYFVRRAGPLPQLSRSVDFLQQ